MAAQTALAPAATPTFVVDDPGNSTTSAGESSQAGRDLIMTIGTSVQLQFFHRKEVNGCRGEVVTYHDDRARYEVHLLDGRTLAVKRTTVKMVGKAEELKEQFANGTTCAAQDPA